MRIYVAGEVPRKHRDKSALRSKFDELKPDPLTRIYRRITDAALEMKSVGESIELKLPYPDPKIDQMDPKTFAEYLRHQIGKSDAVLTVFFPPGIAVGFEAHLASDLRKPQTVLMPKSVRVPRYLRALPGVVKIHTIEDVQLRDVLVELTSAVQETAGGIEYA